MPSDTDALKSEPKICGTCGRECLYGGVLYGTRDQGCNNWISRATSASRASITADKIARLEEKVESLESMAEESAAGQHRGFNACLDTMSKMASRLSRRVSMHGNRIDQLERASVALCKAVAVLARVADRGEWPPDMAYDDIVLAELKKAGWEA